MNSASRDTIAASTQGPTSATAAVRHVPVKGNRIDSRDLFAADREIIIAHNEGDYRLRLTSQNKLILTK